MFGSTKKNLERRIASQQEVIDAWKDWHDDVSEVLQDCIVVASPEMIDVYRSVLYGIAGDVVTPSKLRKMNISRALADMASEAR